MKPLGRNLPMCLRYLAYSQSNNAYSQDQQIVSQYCTPYSCIEINSGLILNLFPRAGAVRSILVFFKDAALDLKVGCFVASSLKA